MVWNLLKTCEACRETNGAEHVEKIQFALHYLASIPVIDSDDTVTLLSDSLDKKPRPSSATGIEQAAQLI